MTGRPEAERYLIQGPDSALISPPGLKNYLQLAKVAKDFSRKQRETWTLRAHVKGYGSWLLATFENGEALEGDR